MIFTDCKSHTLDVIICFCCQKPPKMRVAFNRCATRPFIPLFYLCITHTLVPKCCIYLSKVSAQFLWSLKQNLIQIRCSIFPSFFAITKCGTSKKGICKQTRAIHKPRHPVSGLHIHRVCEDLLVMTRPPTV